MEHSENVVIDMTSVLNTTTESSQSNQTYEEFPQNVLPPFNLCECVEHKVESRKPGGMLSLTTTIHTLFFGLVLSLLRRS